MMPRLAEDAAPRGVHGLCNVDVQASSKKRLNDVRQVESFLCVNPPVTSHVFSLVLATRLSGVEFLEWMLATLVALSQVRQGILLLEEMIECVRGRHSI